MQLVKAEIVKLWKEGKTDGFADVCKKLGFSVKRERKPDPHSFRLETVFTLTEGDLTVIVDGSGKGLDKILPLLPDESLLDLLLLNIADEDYRKLANGFL